VGFPDGASRRDAGGSNEITALAEVELSSFRFSDLDLERQTTPAEANPDARSLDGVVLLQRCQVFQTAPHCGRIAGSHTNAVTTNGGVS
jgi:hypothetical protein